MTNNINDNWNNQLPEFKLTPEEWKEADELIPIKQIVKKIITIEEYRNLQGEFLNDVHSVKEINGQFIEEQIEYFLIDSLGRHIPCQSIVGDSWTELPIPQDSYSLCKNPWKYHFPRAVFIEVDGFQTDIGNVLCTECWDLNEKKKKLKEWLNIIYAPEIF
ncbi:MAG: hypothetical protein GY705_31795 [Bacteroidetes bacterium]|nr:hypothetical protein [Bacteroidota bacterium]